MDTKCEVAGCVNSPRSGRVKGLCSAHYQRLRIHGDLQVGIPVGYREPRAACSINSCERPSVGKQLCAGHRERLRKHGDAQADVPFKSFGKGHRQFGYKVVVDHEHPLADKRGRVMAHRKVMFDLVGEGPHPCFWCGVVLPWTKTRADKHLGIQVDHVDGDRDNNQIENLVLTCCGCNTRKRQRGDHRARVLEIAA